MFELAPLIYDLAIMLGLAGIVLLLFQRIHQPVVLGYLVAGMIIGPYTPPHALVNDITNIHILSQLGVIFLMFSLGLDFSFQKLVRVGYSAAVTGFIEVFLMLVIGFSLGKTLGWTTNDALFLAAALSISSTTIIIKAIDDLGFRKKRFAELIFGILIIEDLLAIMLLVALSTIVTTNNVLSLDMVYANVRLVLVVGSWFLVGYFIVPSLFRNFAHYINQEMLTVISVAFCLTLVCIAAEFNYSTALGAFIMGSILAETTLVHRIEELIRPIRDIFAAVFFISVGMLINPIVILENLPIVLLISLITILAKILVTGFGALFTGQQLKTSVRVGFSMAQIGEFSFIIASLGLALNAIDNKLYPLIVAVSAITTFATPYLIRASGYIGNYLNAHLPPSIHTKLSQYAERVEDNNILATDKVLLRMVALRLFLNGIMVSFIFALVHYIVFKRFLFANTWMSDGGFLWISFVLASPFVWGMFFAHQTAAESVGMRAFSKTKIIIFRAITIAELVILTIVYFDTWMGLMLASVASIIIFFLIQPQLKIIYQSLERQLVNNIRFNQFTIHSQTDWRDYLTEITIEEGSPLVGERIDSRDELNEDLALIAIYRGDKVMYSPPNVEMLAAYDRIIIFGNTDKLNLITELAKAERPQLNAPSLLPRFSLSTIQVTWHHDLVGMRVRDVQHKKLLDGKIVGIERADQCHIKPHEDMHIKVGDVLLVVRW